jgi:hypothetical protein
MEKPPIYLTPNLSDNVLPCIKGYISVKVKNKSQYFHIKKQGYGTTIIVPSLSV